MKTLCLFLLGVVAASFLQGQTLTLTNDTFSRTGYADELEIITYGTLVNHSSDTVLVLWSRTVEDIPAGWESKVCDNIQCYTPETNLITDPFSIPANNESNLDVHFSANDAPGTGTVVVKAWVMGDSTNTVVQGVFKGSALAPVGIEDKVEKENLLIYPNPAKDYIMIKNLPVNEITTVEVYNIFGRKMLSFSQPPSANESAAHKFDLGGLPKGIYMIRIFDGDMNMIYTMSLSKE